MAGSVLPSEAALSRVYRASRITVRKSLEMLRGEGLVESRQGFGWLAVLHPLRQSLGRFMTMEAQMAENGVVPSRKIIATRRERAEGKVKEILGDRDLVVVTRLNLADGLPFARVTVWAPEELGSLFSTAELEERSFYQLLGERGILDAPLARAIQTTAAVAIDASDARLLGVPKGSPALLCERITYDAAGSAILYSVSAYPGHKTEFVIELNREPESIAPSGMRLVT